MTLDRLVYFCDTRNMDTETLTFGETIRRLRRARQWSLRRLSDETGLAYSYLSRVENDSASPQAEVVAKLAEALDGDLRDLLELAACLPRVILDRIIERGDSVGPTLNRQAGAERPNSERDPVGALIVDLALQHGLSVPDAHRVADAVGRLVGLPDEMRNNVTALILSLEANGASE
ncbi:MAG: XRE family transcriptional regulator [Dehalococcoidia bacterium]|nr:MAG: XRE family transcriptional regulator [Dehalococcoidia bacterium]